MLTRNAPNNSVTSRAYEEFTGRLSRYTQSVGGVAFSDFSYAYTDRGNIAEIIESGTGATARTRRYSYDSLERLIDVDVPEIPNQSEFYILDEEGNRTSSQTSLTHATDAANRLSSDDDYVASAGAFFA